MRGLKQHDTNGQCGVIIMEKTDRYQVQLLVQDGLGKLANVKTENVEAFGIWSDPFIQLLRLFHILCSRM